MKSFIISAVMALCSLYVTAQTTTGRVTDAVTGQPLAGATVKQVGKAASVTDNQGRFTVHCGTSQSAAISHVGYQGRTINVKNCNEALAVALQPLSQYMDEVEVSATSSQNKQLLYQPAAITKLGEVELKRGTGLFLDDAINANVPGVTMNRRTISAGQQFNLRGYGNGSRGTRGPSSNFDGQGYKVYLNGIPVTDAEGITVMDDIDFGSIGNVEVTKGPAGTLYGLAIAGAVNLRSLQPAKGVTSISQEAIVGNYGLRRYNTQLQIGRERSSLLVNYGHQLSDGVTFHNKSKKDYVNMIANFTPSEKQSIDAYLGYSNSYDERYGELTVAQWNNNDYSGNPEYIKRNAHSAVRIIRAGASHTYQFCKAVANTTSLFGTGFFSDASSAGGWTDKNFLNYGVRSTINAQIKLSNTTRLSGITGIEAQGQKGQTVGYSMKKSPFDTTTVSAWTPAIPYWVINTATSNFFTTTSTASLFTEWTLALPYDIAITAGVGVSNQKINLNDRFNTATTTKPATFDTAYKNMVSPHIAINKVFNKMVSVYVSYSKGYKAPTSSYFFITTPQVNTTPVTPAGGRLNNVLKPEVGNQFEVGSKGQLLNNKLQYELAYFSTVFSNKMTSVAVASPLQPNTTLYSYMVNGGKQKHQGLELLVRYTAYESSKGFFRSLRPFANFTYNNFKYVNFTYDSSATKRVNFDGKNVAGAAKTIFNAGVDMAFQYGLYANLNVNYRDKMPLTADNALYAPSYTIVNGKLGIRRSLSSHFDIDAYIGSSNITSSKYYFMVFANQLPDAYLPAPSTAQVFGGATVRYNF